MHELEHKPARSATRSVARDPSHARNRAPGFSPAPAGHTIVQLQRAYGNRYVQRMLARVAFAPGEAKAPPEVAEAIERARGSGHSLDAVARAQLEPALGADFGSVRVHTGAGPDALNRALNARAFTTGNDIFFRAGEYSPQSSAGRALLAHELTHVVQQAGAPIRATLTVGAPDDRYELEADAVARAIAQHQSGRIDRQAEAATGRSIRRQEVGAEDWLRWTGRTAEPRFRFRLDPELEAQIWATQRLDLLLSPETIRLSLGDLDTVLGAPPPPWLTGPPVPSPAPLVEPGRGPAEVRAARTSDVLDALMAVDAVNAALNRLKSRALGELPRLRREWTGMSALERALVISESALVSGTILTGVLANAETRALVLNTLQNRTLPIPGVPGLTFQFSLTGPEQRLRFDLNVGALLPSSWGFR